MTTSIFINIVVVLSLLITIENSADAQDLPLSESIAVTSRPSKDSITLRWAPLSFDVWRKGNQFGYTVERYVVARGETILDMPEKTVLRTSLMPLPEERWESIVGESSYAAIAAQALYGDRFEIDLSESDMFSIANKVQENEQRYYFALFSADMSATVARASGLLFADTTVIANEKYLYRIHVTGMDTLRGSIFITPLEPYWLQAPQNPKIEFKDKLVSLRWNRALSTPYTAYKIERSEDGTTFHKIFESPITTLSPDATRSNDYEYATDSIPQISKVYYYRITGITPFGEEGPASAVISGRSMPVVEQVPYIISAQSENNRTIFIQWEFPETNNAAIKGFSVARASSPATEFLKLTPSLLNPTSRLFEDSIPNGVNYYRVDALGYDNEWYSSHVYFSQLIDSIPPLTPTELKATVDDQGVIAISWTTNKEKDIYGYRVYKANHKNEEVVQLTSAPITVSVFFDTVDLNVLNESVFYSVMSTDANQNHSPLSALLEVRLPDKVRPQPPVLLPVSSTDNKVILTWQPGGSDDIIEYRVYRKSSDVPWQFLEAIPATDDSLFSFVDARPGPGNSNRYTVISIDDAGLESDPPDPVQAVLKGHRLKPPIQWRKPRLTSEENEISISWNYDLADVDVFTIYRSKNSNPFILHETISADARAYKERIIPGTTYRYRIMAAFQDGSKSALSDELLFEY